MKFKRIQDRKTGDTKKYFVDDKEVSSEDYYFTELLAMQKGGKYNTSYIETTVNHYIHIHYVN